MADGISGNNLAAALLCMLGVFREAFVVVERLLWRMDVSCNNLVALPLGLCFSASFCVESM